MPHTAWSTDLENFLHSCPGSPLDVTDWLADHSEIPTQQPSSIHAGGGRKASEGVWGLRGGVGWNRKWGLIIDGAALKTCLI